MKPILQAFIAAIFLLATAYGFIYWYSFRVMNNTLVLVDEANVHCQSEIGVTKQYTVQDYKRDTGMSQEQFGQQQAECHHRFMEANKHRLAK